MRRGGGRGTHGAAGGGVLGGLVTGAAGALGGPRGAAVGTHQVNHVVLIVLKSPEPVRKHMS